MLVKDFKFLDRENYFEVYFDDNSKLLVDYKTFEKYKISVELEITEEIYEEIKYFSDIQIAKKRAYMYISKRMKTKREVFRKLIELGFDENVAMDTVSFLEEEKFLDDREYAKLFIEEKVNLNGYGKNKIKSLLYQKGIREDVFSDLLEELDCEEEFENAMEFAKRKLALLDTDDKYKVKQKIYSHLSYKGFDFSVIDRVLRELL